MESITVRDLTQGIAAVLRRVIKGESLILRYRGKPVARLEPLKGTGSDPFLAIGERATPSPKGKTQHAHLDELFY